MIALAGLVIALASAPSDAKGGLRSQVRPDSARAVATRATAADAVDTSKAPARATKAVGAGTVASDSVAATPAAAVRDTTETHHLPPRTLPLKRQMIFAGGFMVFLALMMTSLQNFNPND